MWPKSIQEIAEFMGAQWPAGPTPSTASGSAQLINALSTDSRRVSSGDLFVAIRGETHDGHNFVEASLTRGASAAVVEKGWLSQHPHLVDRCIAVEDTTQAIRNLAKAFRNQFSFPVFAIGGSNGKTTTKEMLAALLNSNGQTVTRTHKSENGYLGLAITLTQKSHNKSNPPKALVAEIGIDEVGAMDQHVAIANPDIALLTALGPEHLAGLGSWDKAVEEELLLFRRSSPKCRRIWQLCEPRLADVCREVRPGDVIVCASEAFTQFDPVVKSLFRDRQISRLSFRISEQRASYSLVQTDWQDQQKSWQASFKIPLPGLHNAQNFALALATAALTGLTPQQLADSWNTFVPPEMRSRIVTLKSDVTLYDDCYNASPASMDAAFDALLSDEWKSRHKILVLGDMLDLGEESKSWHLKLVEKLLKIQNADLCLFGTAMYDVFKEIKTNHSHALHTGNIRLRHAGPEGSPAQFLNEIAERLPGSVVLVKGSRGMDLGRFVQSCEAWSSAQG